jgi:hypothetical protein
MNERRNRRRRRWHLATIGAAVLWALLMAPLLWWGLPTSAHDDRLFGGQPAWEPQRYDVADTLEQLRHRDAGADTDLNPIRDRDRIVDLTATDADRAEILRRYRLYSYQPDEMITLRALQRMQPRAGDFDPRLYQYGGGYIYLIGAALGIAGVTGLIELTSDAAVYLQRPEAFAGFYIVARCVSLVFGGLALLAVHELARRAFGRSAGWIAMACVALSPEFITAVLEAKPHLPSACMVLWATLSALDCRVRGRLSDGIRLGLQAGYAFGLVLTGVVAVLLWPAVFFMRRTRGVAGRLALAGGLAIVVWVITNPYIPYNLLLNRGALGSNISNSTAMYAGQMQQAGAGALRVAELMLESMGPGMLLAGIVGLIMLARRHRETWIVAAPGLGMLLIAVLTGAGKPAEFARFLVLPCMLLCVAAGVVLGALVRRRVVLGVLLTVVVLVLGRAGAYERAFHADLPGKGGSRAAAARYLLRQAGPDAAIGVIQEPAPYAVPPLDFTRRTIRLLPEQEPADLDPNNLPNYLVFTADDDRVHADAWWQAHYELETTFPKGMALARIAWANKPVFVYVRSGRGG